MQRSIQEFEREYVCGLVFNEPLHFQNIFPPMLHDVILQSRHYAFMHA